MALLSGFRSTLRDSPPPPISLYVENLDLGRFGGGRFNDAVQAYFREKYHDKPIGVIVAVGAAALRLVLGLRNALWAEMPVIFAAVDEGVTDRLVLPPKVTGLTVRAPLSDSVSVARAVVPDLKRLAIVGDPPERQFIRVRVAEQLKQLATEFELIDLTRLTMTELKRRVASLPSDSAIIYIGLTLDAGNVAYTSSEALAAFAGVAGRPIVVQAENQLGTGAIGGIVASPALIGRETARLVLHVLAGENPLNIPVTTASVMKPIFDWRQLQRWNVRESRLPPGSEIRFRQPTIWEQYRPHIWAVGAAIILQAALIGWLLHEHRRRQAAEITARNTMSELMQMNCMATAGELSASIAHEVSQPLTGISARASAALRWLRSQPPNLDRVRAALEQIDGASHRASEIVKNVRGLFAKDAQARKAVNINSVFSAVLLLVRIELQKHQIRLETELSDRLPPVMGVEVQLQQVILNLVMNAIEAMHSAEPRVLSVRSELSESGGVCVSVEDTGTGIDASSVDQVFKPLFTTKASGMGMGLSICHSIIQNHNGRIWVSAGPKRGTIFKFVLPAIEPGARDPEDGLPVAGGGLPPKMKQLRVEGTPPAEVKDHGSAH